MLTHTWESLKTVPESVLLAGGRSSKSMDPSCASTPKREDVLESRRLSRTDFSREHCALPALSSITMSQTFSFWLNRHFKKSLLDSYLLWKGWFPTITVNIKTTKWHPSKCQINFFFLFGGSGRERQGLTI